MKAAYFDEEEAFALYKKGLNDRVIGEELDVPTQSIQRWRKRNGLPANTKRGGQEKPVTEPPKKVAVCSARYCKGCVHFDKYGPCCNYYLKTGLRRPCPPGKGCTVKEIGKNKPRPLPDKKGRKKRGKE